MKTTLVLIRAGVCYMKTTWISVGMGWDLHILISDHKEKNRPGSTFLLRYKLSCLFHLDLPIQAFVRMLVSGVTIWHANYVKPMLCAS